MFGTEGLLPDRQRAPVRRLGFTIAALRAIHLGYIVEAYGDRAPAPPSSLRRSPEVLSKAERGCRTESRMVSSPVQRCLGARAVPREIAARACPVACAGCWAGEGGHVETRDQPWAPAPRKNPARRAALRRLSAINV